MIEIGIVGKPSSGKSTFFKAATMKEGVKIAPYPFTTIEPNEGIAYVRVTCPCKELGKDCKKCINGFRFVPVKLVDVAGLVPRAHEGRGMGNQFLSNIARVECLIHILDLSGLTDEEGNPCSNYDIEKDIAWLEEEIVLWIKGILERNVKGIKTHEKVSKCLTGIGIRKEHVEKALERCGLDNFYELAREIRRISKPIVLAGNKIDVESSKRNYERLKEKYRIIPCSALAELALKTLAREGKISYVPGDSSFKVVGSISEKEEKVLSTIKKEVLDYCGSTNVQQVMEECVFKVLGYVPVFPVENEEKLSDSKGNVLPDVFLMKSGSKVIDVARKIHSEMAKNFICAIDARTKKKLGRDDEVYPGMIVSVKFK